MVSFNFIPSNMCSPTWETHIPSDMCSWEIHIPSDMCSPACLSALL